MVRSLSRMNKSKLTLKANHHRYCSLFRNVSNLKVWNVVEVHGEWGQLEGGRMNYDLWLTISTSTFSFSSRWKMHKSVRGISPRLEKPIANQLNRSLMPFFTWKNTFRSGQSTIHVSFTCSTGSRVIWCIWFGATSEAVSVSGREKEVEMRPHQKQ